MQNHHYHVSSCDSESQSSAVTTDDTIECTEVGNWSSDCSNSDEEDQQVVAGVPVRFVYA